MVQISRSWHSFMEIRWAENSGLIWQMLQIVHFFFPFLLSFQTWLQTDQGWKVSSRENFWSPHAAWIPYFRCQEKDFVIPWATANAVISARDWYLQHDNWKWCNSMFSLYNTGNSKRRTERIKTKLHKDEEFVSFSQALYLYFPVLINAIIFFARMKHLKNWAFFL